MSPVIPHRRIPGVPGSAERWVFLIAVAVIFLNSWSPSAHARGCLTPAAGGACPQVVEAHKGKQELGEDGDEAKAGDDKEPAAPIFKAPKFDPELARHLQSLQLDSSSPRPGAGKPLESTSSRPWPPALEWF